MDAHNLEGGNIVDEIVEVSASLPSEDNIHPGRIVCRVARCTFSDASNSLRETEERSASMRKLWGGIILCLIITSIEVIFGARAHSLAILTDAAHMLSDVVAFAIALFSVWASGWQPTPRHSYGFLRIGILGALVSTLSIWGLTAYLQYEAVHRLIHIHDMHKVKGSLMFGIALAGLVVNILMMFIFGHGHGHLHGHDHGNEEHDDHGHGRDDVSVTTNQPDHHDNDHTRNINVRGAYLHIIGDLIQSIGVVIGAGIIWCKPKLKIIDPICTLLFSIIVLCTTIPMLRDILEVLMESTPRKIDATSLERGLCEINEVVAIHELHIWAISVGKVLLSCHVRIRPEANADMVLHEVVDYIKRAHKIDHVTIQIERE